MTQFTVCYLFKTEQHFLYFIKHEYYDSFTICFYLLCKEQKNIFCCKNVLNQKRGRGGKGREVVYIHAVRKIETFYDKIGNSFQWKLWPISHLLTVTETLLLLQTNNWYNQIAKHYKRGKLQINEIYSPA
jgi:hypothetical protein